MGLQIPAAGHVLQLVFIAWAVGTAVGGAATRIGGEVQAGHFKVVWLTTAVLAAAGALSNPLAWTVTAAALATFASIYAKRDAIVGTVCAVVSMAVMVEITILAVTNGKLWLAILFELSAMLLLGSITSAMLLGHWHLNQPRLGTGPLNRLVTGQLISIATFVATSGLILASGLSRHIDVAIIGPVTAIAFSSFCVILTLMVRHLVKTRSIMSATGILYLQILLAFVAVFTGTLGSLSLVS